MGNVKCLTCGKDLTEEQLIKAERQHREPKYCSSECWGKRTREYNYDHTFLDTMTPFAAYFWGLFVTDGSISEDGIRIGLINKKIIEDIIRITNYKKSYGPYIRKDRPEIKPFYVVNFAGNVFKRIKEEYPIGPKTGKEFIPFCITDDVFSHFLRGAWDGDGTWTKPSEIHGYVQCSIVSASRFFLVAIWNKLKELNIVKTGNLHEEIKEGCMTKYYLSFGHEDSQRIGDFIYKDADIKMDYKYERYLAGKNKILLQKQAGLICLVEGCGQPTIAKNLCKIHYDQQCGKQYREAHKEEIYEKQKIYIEGHRDEINEKRRENYSNNSEYLAAYAADWRKNNPEKVKEIKRKHRETHREEINEYKKAYRKAHLEEARAKDKERHLRNKEKRNQQAKERYYRNKEANRDKLNSESR